METTKIYLAEDQAMLVTALAALLDLEDDLEVIGTARDGKTALLEIQRLQPDLVILDIEMPEMSGLEVAAALREKFPDLKVMILTTFAQESYFQKAVDAQVNGYLLKDSSSEKLVRVIRDVMEGDTVFAPELVRNVLRADKCPFSQRELEVLKAVETGASTSEISKSVYLSEGTVRNYISSILSKTGTNNRIEAINVSRENKWI
ncbi:MAG: response regulator transcription factor [Streptococcaceae bacterium]|nr:response regulator transcription factor [Streptococcaceae bacterium]